MRASLLQVIVGLFVCLTFATAQAGDGPPVRKDVNTVTAKDLTQVKGIGKKIAAKIIAKRDELGGFKSMYQIQEIKGIGKATLGKLICAFYVKAEGELPCKAAPVKKAAIAGKVNLNTADVKQLTSLKGMGKKKAAKIIDYRRENGYFQSPHELTNIKGIGKKTVENFLPYLEVRVDINTARAAQFEALGLGNGDRIVAAREKAGGFKSIEELGKLECVDADAFGKAKSILILNAEAQ